MKRINKSILYIAFFLSILGSIHLVYIFSYFPEDLINLTLGIDFFAFLVFLYLMYRIQIYYVREETQKKILCEILEEDRTLISQSILKVKSMLEYVKNSNFSQNFLLEHQKDFLEIENQTYNSCFDLTKESSDILTLTNLLASQKTNYNKILIDYINKTNELIKLFTTIDFVSTLFSTEANLDFLHSYLNRYFILMEKVYNQISNFSKEFHLDTKLIKKEIQSLQQNSDKIKNSIQNYNTKTEDFIEFVKQFTNVQMNFINQIFLDYEKNLEILKSIQEISEKIKMLSLNLSIEASRTSSNKVFDVLSEELQSFSQKIQNFAFRIREEILHTNEKIREETHLQLKQLESIKSKIEVLTSIQKEIQDTFNNLEQVNQDLMSRSTEILQKSENSLKNFLDSYQNLKVIEESFKNIFILLEEKNKNFEINLNSITQLLYNTENIQSDILEKIFLEFIKIIKSDIELEILYDLCDKYNLPKLKEQIKANYSQKDIILF